MSGNEKPDAAPQDDGKQVVPAEGADAGEMDVRKKCFTYINDTFVPIYFEKLLLLVYY